MRNLLVLGLMASFALPSAVAAQSQKEIQKDIRKLERQQQDLEDAKRNGTFKDVKEQREDIRDAQEELREDVGARVKKGYAAPFSDWTYSTLSPGAQLRPEFYGTPYVITDRDTYKLAPTAGEQQWIRYGNDILLVNVKEGRVVEVLRDRY